MNDLMIELEFLDLDLIDQVHDYFLYIYHLCRIFLGSFVIFLLKFQSCFNQIKSDKLFGTNLLNY